MLFCKKKYVLNFYIQIYTYYINSTLKHFINNKLLHFTRIIILDYNSILTIFLGLPTPLLTVSATTLPYPESTNLLRILLALLSVTLK